MTALFVQQKAQTLGPMGFFASEPHLKGSSPQKPDTTAAASPDRRMERMASIQEQNGDDSGMAKKAAIVNSRGDDSLKGATARSDGQDRRSMPLHAQSPSASTRRQEQASIAPQIPLLPQQQNPDTAGSASEANEEPSPASSSSPRIQQRLPPPAGGRASRPEHELRAEAPDFIPMHRSRYTNIGGL
jgi:hypothetical protein